VPQPVPRAIPAGVCRPALTNSGDSRARHAHRSQPTALRACHGAIDRAMTHMGGISTIFHAAPPLVSRSASGQPESGLIAHPSG